MQRNIKKMKLLIKQGFSDAEIARKIGVHRSTAFRLRKQAKLQPGRKIKAPTKPADPVSDMAPDALKNWILSNFDLAPAERALLDLAVTALEVSRDTSQSASVRLMAAGRFQSLLKDLRLPNEEEKN